MWFRRLLPVFLGIVAGLGDVAVSPWLPGPLTAVRAALPFVVLLALFSSPRRAFAGALAAGITVDALTPTFGLVTLRLLCAVGAVLLMSRLYFTNRTLFGSWVLGGVGILTDRVLLWLAVNARTLVATEPVIAEISAPFLATCLWMSVCITLAFWIFAAFTRRFLPSVSIRR